MEKENVVQNSQPIQFVQQTASVPPSVDFHLILDHELDQLSRPEAGIAGSLGFIFLGSALSFAPIAINTFRNKHLTPSPWLSLLCTTLAVLGYEVP